MLVIESGLAALFLAVAILHPSLGSAWFQKAERVFDQLSQHPRIAVIAVGLLTLALRAAVVPLEPIPEPVVHDEFGYLLAADTFAHGRLTNPTPPLSEHFESFSIIVKPTYQCYAQPAQGLILAFGKVFFGHPFWGVWLSAGLTCAAITWMLQGWLPPQWALLGGLLAILRFGVFSYWANSYWAGLAGVIGGALVIGAFPRIKSKQRISDAIFMGVGLVLLANSRPYEGVLFAVPVAVALFVWLFGENRPRLAAAFRTTIAALLLVLAANGLWMTYYFWRVTGNPFQMPYQVERLTYANVPQLLWQHRPSEQKTTYSSQAMKQLYVNGEMSRYRVMRMPLGFVYIQAGKVLKFWKFYLGPALSLPFLLLFFALPYGFSCRHTEQSTKLILALLAFCTIGMSAELFFEPHYAGPLTAIVLLLVLKAVRIVRHWTPNARPVGLFVARSIPVICVIMFVVRAGSSLVHHSLPEADAPGWSQQAPPSFGRDRIQAELQSMPGQHLVIVHYGPKHNPFREWVYNDADIPGAKIIWARETDNAGNRQLIDCFRGRKVWLLEADEEPPKLNPWPQI